MNRGQINLILSTLAFVVSSAGSVLLHIVFATTIYRSTGSGLMTALFLSLQWLPVLVVVLVKSDWEDGVNPCARWIKFDCLSGFLTLPVLLFIDEPNYLALFLLLFARGVVDHITRIVKTVSARYIFPREKVGYYASILQAGYHVGIGLAALAGFVFAQYFSLHTVVIVDICSFLLAAAMMGFVTVINDVEAEQKRLVASLGHRLRQYRDTLSSRPKLFFCAALAPLSATFFQGTYSALQPTFPMRGLGLDASAGQKAVTISYLLASAAIVGGSSLYAYLSKRQDFYGKAFNRTKVIIFLLALFSASMYMASVATSDYRLSGLCFSLMVLSFELLFMFGYGGIVALAPKGQLGSVFGFGFSLGCSAASVCVVLTGCLLDRLGNNFLAVAGIFMTAFLLSLMTCHHISRRLSNRHVNAVNDATDAELCVPSA